MKNRSTPNGPNYVWDNFTMDFSFDTTGTDVSETDTVTIQLPSELRTREAYFDVTDKNTGGVAMKCVIPAASARPSTVRSLITPMSMSI